MVKKWFDIEDARRPSAISTYRRYAESGATVFTSQCMVATLGDMRNSISLRWALRNGATEGYQLNFEMSGLCPSHLVLTAGCQRSDIPTSVLLLFMHAEYDTIDVRSI